MVAPTQTPFPSSSPVHALAVWDLPTRLFHWTLVLLVAFLLISGEVGGDSLMNWHMRAGYGVVTLVLFRILWGFVGSRHSRFAAFVRGPRETLAYTQNLLRGHEAPTVGHNPLGGWMVVALLLLLLIQGGSGFFTSDDISVDGPLVAQAAGSLVRRLSSLHRITAKLLFLFPAIHVAAVLFHQWVKGEKLIQAMITGDKAMLPGDLAAEASQGKGRTAFASPLRALGLLALAAAAVWAALKLL